MTRENLARKFRPAGFEQPEGWRRNYVRPRRELQEAFYQWITELPKKFDGSFIADCEYEKAEKMIKPFGEIPYREANSLLTDFKPKTEVEKDAGIFVSACYNQAPEEIIVFDLDTPEIWSIGHDLEKGKILINNGSVGDFLGCGSSGVVLNNGHAERQFGSWDSSGISVNMGEAGHWFGHKSSGIVIALQEPESYADPVCRGFDTIKLVLDPSTLDSIPKLKNYLEELSEITKSIKDEESVKRFLERYGPEPGERIEQEIKRILMMRGFRV